MSVPRPVLPTGISNYEFVSRISGQRGAFGELWKVRVGHWNSPWTPVCYLAYDSNLGALCM